MNGMGNMLVQAKMRHFSHIGIAVLFALTLAVMLPFHTLICTYVSPDKTKRLELYSIQTYYYSLPGQAGDNPCLIVLVDLSRGREVFRRTVSMIQLVDNVHFGDKGVSINDCDGIFYSGKTWGDWGGDRASE